MCVSQMRAHHDAFKRPPAWLPGAALPQHWSWVARQHRAFAELLSARTPWGGSASAAAGAAAGTMPLPSPPPPNAPRTYLPGFWYHAAANATEKLRRAVESVDADADPTVSERGRRRRYIRRDVRTRRRTSHHRRRVPQARQRAPTHGSRAGQDVDRAAHQGSRSLQANRAQGWQRRIRQALRVDRRQAGAWVPARG